MNKDVKTLLDEADHVLIAFDGPVCTVFDPGVARSVAERLRILLGTDLPRSVRRTADPFEVLRYADSCGEHTAHVVERQLARLETEAVSVRRLTEGAIEAVRTLHDTGHGLTAIGNTSTEAIRCFLGLHDLWTEVGRISARGRGRTTKLLPDPFLLTEAVEALGSAPRRCVFIGASAVDAEAGEAAGIRVLRLGDAIGSMAELADRDLLAWHVR